ncbi:hypothetical protein V9T40_001812 [Parthenolecanium corni]|uniref:Cysteine--tRNA ligase, cytoplasmic n=1 Tax=Parthenolecanium corni TaxID=536013 RepID=A0AAN9TH90_9HEMI
MSKRTQPVRSTLPSCAPVLYLFNSLTRRKEEFKPRESKLIRWYSCGPTVYDAAHMGHARSYISFDILRRILSEYFGYDVKYVMNITDIDDKIIKRARQNYLFQKYLEEEHSNDEILSNVRVIAEKLAETIEGTQDNDKKGMFMKLHADVLNVLSVLEKETKPSEKKTDIKKLLSEVKDSYSEFLDSKYGSNINDNSIFTALPRHWENEFHEDMHSLNILDPSVLTRVSEYVPEIIEYIQKIIVNGLAYESNGSVYFDVGAFDAKPNHFYAKLVPEAYGDTKSLQEGEGDLFTDVTEKKSVNDFALWKASKSGEPWWDSPWGKGRPGWHIECSVMASAILGETLDIHTGGVDLKFPHHDNELAQAEAYYDNDCWVRYFLHSGHLTIAGCKMSKSLKNFITIKDALKKYTARQLRFAFLLHKWNDTLDYSENTMEMAITYEKLLNEYFLNTKDLVKKLNTQEKSVSLSKWTDAELKLDQHFCNMQKNVHIALCDNIDTRTALDAIRECISFCNVYVKDRGIDSLNLILLRDVASYIIELMQIFGVIPRTKPTGFPISSDNTAANLEDILSPYLTVFAEFRHAVRQEARECKAFNILKECDKVRDDTLPNLGVRLEDQEGRCATIKLVDKDTLLREREEKLRIERKKAEEKEKRLAQLAEKEAQRKIPPTEMFKKETDKYSKFDDKGLPTHDTEGKELSKGLVKKLQKLQLQQEKKYTEYLNSVK